MKIYAVGGAVRDTLLGLPVKDRDYVVVGATPEQMVKLGYTPVGKDFPVFLHPQTHEEYALARTERKTAPGYKGFVFHTDASVSLEEDLVRRDLTINAMAQGQDGEIVDPFGGRADLQQRLFRHVSDAFAEDPVRILRVARFAARFTEFAVAPQTNELMRQMVEAGEVDALVPERVWQELARGLMEAQPSRMFAVLRDCGALARIAPELDALWSQPAIAEQMMAATDAAAAAGRTLAVRFAALTYRTDMFDALCRRLKVPNDCRDLARIVGREWRLIGFEAPPEPDAAVALLERCDAFRKPERFGEALLAVSHIAHAGALPQAQPFADYWRRALQAAQRIDSGAAAARAAREAPSNPAAIPQAIHAARVAAVAAITTA